MLGTFIQNSDPTKPIQPTPQSPNSIGKLNFGHETPWMTRAFSLSMPAHSEPAMEPLGIVQLTPTLSKGIFGVHTKHRGNQLWWENSSTSSLAEVAMCQGSKWEVWLWSFKLPQTAGIKDPTLKYQGADRAPWLVSVIPAGAEPLCVHVRNLLGSGSCWEANMALAPLLGRGLCLPLQAAGGSHRWSHPYSSPNMELPPLPAPPALG